jgi:hypothetical protein
MAAGDAEDQLNAVKQKRREDAHALPKLSRNIGSRSSEFRTKCFWSAMRPRIAFLLGVA